MRNRKKCSCAPKGCIKPQDRYCGEPLDCIGVTSGDTFSDVLTSINEIMCNQEVNSCNLVVSIENNNESQPVVAIQGGAPPYSYYWTLQQSGGTSYQLIDPTVPIFPYPVNLYLPDGDCVASSLPSGIPCRVSATIANDPTHALHFKLTVTDSNGCTAKDYWTVYHLNTY